MSSRTARQLRSIRRWLYVVVFLLGVVVVLLGDVANAARGNATLLPSLAALAGGGVSVSAVLFLFFPSYFSQLVESAD